MEQETENFKKLMFSLIKKFKAHFEQKLKDAGIGITPLQYAILTKLNKKGVTLNDLSKNLANKPPTLIPPIDHLETDGYLKKYHDLNDRRKVRIAITPKGQMVLKKMPVGSSSELLAGSLKKMGKQKTILLFSLLSELTEQIHS